VVWCKSKSLNNHHHETGFRLAIYYIATTLIQEFQTQKMLGQEQKHAQSKKK
jgi:hypothetical protein